MQHHNKTNLLRNTYQRGFSLIELMVVIVILGVLGAIIVPNVMSKIDKSKIAATKTNLGIVAGALKEFKMDNGRYPDNLKDLLQAPSYAKDFPEEGYLPGKKAPQDGWKNELQYVGGKNFTLFSFGADGAEGGEGSSADIYYE